MRPVRVQEYRAGSQYDPFWRKKHRWIDSRGALARAPFVTEMFVRHESSPILPDRFMAKNRPGGASQRGQ